LVLIAKHRYITGIALVSTLNEVVATITDYQMKVCFVIIEYNSCDLPLFIHFYKKVLAHDTTENTAELASFLGTFGMATNSLVKITMRIFHVLNYLL
jgi:hypothetical protein